MSHFILKENYISCTEEERRKNTKSIFMQIMLSKIEEEEENDVESEVESELDSELESEVGDEN